MQPRFVHLCLHTEYSLVDGLVRIKPLAARLAEQNMPAIAMTDRSNLFAMVKFYRALQGAGAKPIIGVDALIRNHDEANKPHRLLLLVRNREGYLNLSRLISRSYREGQHLGLAMMDPEWFAGNCDGLIAIAVGQESDIGKALTSGNSERAARLADFWNRLFPASFYLGISRCDRPGEEENLHAMVALAAEKQLPVVAHNDVRFLSQEDFDAHEVRVAIHEGRTLDDPRRPKNFTRQQYLRTEEEMCALFDDIPSALANSVEIAKRCNLELTLGKPVLPEFPIPEGMTTAEYFSEQSRIGLEERLEKILDPEAEEYEAQRKAYFDRLQLELDVINQMGFPGYFLIVADFIQWAKDNAIPVGPGRGSGAGSLVAYALKITDLDPIEHELLFERFLNPERVSMPDFDVDFCMDNRDRVIDYVARTYGRDSVSQIITYGSMAAKAVVRDVGRVLGHPFGFVDRIAKLVPFEVGMTLTRALEQNPEFKEQYQNDEEVGALVDMALKLEGVARNAGKHAGGVVISPTVLTDFTPLYCEAGGENLVTQLDKDDVEAVGLVKFDFLGLRTLTIIDWALATINGVRKQKGEEPVDITAIPVADEQAFKLLKTGNTTAVFQLESHGMQELIRKLLPDNFDDITALVALFRPGPLQSGMVDDFINRKHGRAQVEYPHPDLEPILKPTYGVILYQEQVMQIAQVLAGYTLGGADLLRRAMGKKKPEEMAKQREIFLKGSLERGVEEETATYIFDLMEKFAGYGFNKSHSAAYALVSYQTLWLKTHYPAAFMAAVLSADMDNTDKVVHLIKECRAMELEILPPDINRSEYRFTISDADEIIYGLGAVKGVGESAIEELVRERTANGPYADLVDLCCRIDLRKVNRRVFEALIRAGTLDTFGENRATLMAQVPMALKIAEQQNAMAEAGQNDLFAMDPVEARPVTVDTSVLPQRDAWTDELRLQGELETLGLFLTGHPIDRYENDLTALGVTRLAALQEMKVSRERGKQEKIRVAGRVEMVARRETQRGPMATVLLDDKTASVDIPFFSDALEKNADYLAVGNMLLIEGGVSYDSYRDSTSLRGYSALTIEEARILYATSMVLTIDHRDMPHADVEQLMEELMQQLQPYAGGNCRVILEYIGHSYEGRMVLGEQWKVTPRDSLLLQLQQVFGDATVGLFYHPVQNTSAVKTAV